MKALIVEDEIAAQQHLQQLMEMHFPTVEIAAVIDNVPGAIAAISRLRPDLIFLDIDIKQGSGFDVLAALPGLSASVIFTTAFNQFAVDAFRYHAVDYLLKPLEEGRVLESVTHSIEQINQHQTSRQLHELLLHLQLPAARPLRIAVSTLAGIDFIEPDDILYAEAEGNYTILKCRSGAAITTSKKLGEMEPQLVQAGFLRIHHSYIANPLHIKRYHRGRGGYVTLADATDLPVAAAKKDEFLKHFLL